MIHFAWPWMALLLPAPLVGYRMRRPAEPQGAGLYLPWAASVAQEDAHAAASRTGRALFAAIWTLLVLASMRPQWVGDPVQVPSSGRRLLLAVDVSGSMAIQDMAGGQSRLQVVQDVAGRFIDRRRGDRVGLILFGTRPYLQAPLTADLQTVHRFLDDAVVGVAGTETAIGDAIGLALKRVEAEDDSGGLIPQTVLILLTDGQNDAGVMTPLEAARMAAETGLRIYTIGVGAAPQPGFYGLSAGNTDLDEGTLRTIARTTGGAYFRAADSTTLEEVYQRIDRMEPANGSGQWWRPRTELFPWPLGLALVLSVPAAVYGARRWT